MPLIYQPGGMTVVRMGELIRERRQCLGLKQVELARRAGLDPSYVAGVEVGRIQLPDPPKLARIADALEMDVGELLSAYGYRVNIQRMAEPVTDYQVPENNIPAEIHIVFTDLERLPEPERTRRREELTALVLAFEQTRRQRGGA